MDISRNAIDGLALIATGGPEAAPKMTQLFVDVAKAASELGRPDLSRQAIDALAAFAGGGPEAWRKATEVLTAVAKAASELEGQGRAAAAPRAAR